MKKKISLILAVVMLLTVAAVPLQAMAAPQKAEPVKKVQTKQTANDVSVEGTNDAGNLISKALETKQDEQTKNDGHNIYSVEMKGKEAAVSFETTENCTVVVGIYDEAGKRMLASGKKEVTKEEQTASVTIETENMPKYFYLRAFLVGTKTLKPLCTVYESPNYTKEMQAFFDKTTSDFAKDEVLNFDTDKTNNFAVYSEDTKVIDSVSGKNIVEEAGNQNQYVIDKADAQITSLKPGDVFAYEYEKDNTLIVKVKDIEVDGDTVTITEDNTSAEEVFDYVKLDAEKAAEDAEVDASNLEEGIIYKGKEESDIASESKAAQAKAFDGQMKGKKSLSYELVNKTLKGDGTSVKVNGELFVNMDLAFKLYISSSYKYTELKFNTETGMNLSITGKVRSEMALAKVRFDPVPGINITVTPKFAMELSGKVTVKGVLKYTCGASYSSKAGYQSLSGKPSFNTAVKSEGTFFFGLVLEPAVNVVSEKLFSLGMAETGGVEIKVTRASSTPPTTKKHDCAECLDGKINFKNELEFKVGFVGLNKSKSFVSHIKIADFYNSLSHAQFGWGTCPFVSYKVTVTVKDDDGNIVPGATVDTDKKTDSKGKVILWKKNGTYTITANKSGFKGGKVSVKVLNGV